MSADGTASKQVGRPFQPGQSGNPSGRPKGSRNKLSESFLADLHADWEKHGPDVIARVRSEKPDAYLKVVASILPKDLNLNISDMDALSDDEIIDRIRSLDAVIRPLLENRDAADDEMPLH